MKKTKGSVLIVSIIMLSITLMAALSIILVSIRNRKVSMNSTRSNQAFQVADMGVEIVMQQLVGGTTVTIDRLDDEIVGGYASCDPTGFIALDLAANAALGMGEVKVILLDSAFNEMDCNTSRQVIEVVRLKAIGRIGEDVRVIEAAVDNTP